jgi:hypothetical protein
MTNQPSFNVEIKKTDAHDAEPRVTNAASDVSVVGGSLWARGESLLLVNQVKAVEGASPELLETMVDGTMRRIKRLLLAELQKHSDEHPAVAGYFRPTPVETVHSVPLRDTNGRMIGSVSHKYKVTQD